MSGTSAQPVSAAVSVEVRGAPPVLDDRTEARIEEIWRAEKRRQGDRLFNGAIFNIEHMAADRITGWFAEYRWVIAQRLAPELADTLHLSPLAATGLTCCREGVLLGRRRPNMAQDPDLWELIPSGGVETQAMEDGTSVSLASQVLVELEEELGIGSASVTAGPTPFATVYDAETSVTDICCRLDVDVSRDDVYAAFAAIATPEHTAVEVVPTEALGGFVFRDSTVIVPGTIAFLTSAGLLG